MSVWSDFMPLISFYNPWKDQKTRFMFHAWRGYIERDQWHKMGYAFITLLNHCKLGCEEKTFYALTADYKYSRSNRENLPLPIQMQLSKKPKIFCQFLHFWNLQWILNILKKRSHSLSISKIIDSERLLYLKVTSATKR